MSVANSPLALAIKESHILGPSRKWIDFTGITKEIALSKIVNWYHENKSLSKRLIFFFYGTEG